MITVRAISLLVACFLPATLIPRTSAAEGPGGFVLQDVPWHQSAMAAVAATDSVAVTLSHDSTVRWWGLPSPGQAPVLRPLGVARWTPPEGAVVALSADGQRVALLEGAGELVVLGRDGGRRTLDPGGRVTALAWVRDALVAGLHGGELRRWGAEGEPLVVPGRGGSEPEEHTAWALAVSRRGKLAVGRGGEFGSVEIRDGETLAFLQAMTLDTPQEKAHPSSYFLPPKGLAWQGEGLLAAASDEALVWDTATGQLVLRAAQWDQDTNFDGVGVAAVALAGGVLWTATGDGVTAWDLATGERRGGFAPPRNWNFAQPTMALRPGAGFVLTGDIHGGIELRDLEGRPLSEPVGLRASVHALALAPSGVVVAGYDDGTVGLWAGRPLRPVGPAVPLHGGRIAAVALSPGGDVLATGSGRSAVLWRLAGEGTPVRLVVDSPVADVAWSRDGRRVAVAEEGGPVRAFTADGAPAARWAGHERGATAVAWGPGDRVASAGEDGIVRVWELGGEGRASKQERRAYTAIAWSEDGSVLATTEAFMGDGPVRLWDAATLAPLRALPAGELGCADVGFAGPFLYAACLDSRARVWRLPEGVLDATVRGFDGYGLAIALSPGGDLLVLGTGGQERALRAWTRVSPRAGSAP